LSPDSTAFCTQAAIPRPPHTHRWLWIYDLLEVETKTIELNELWEDALGDVCHDAPEFDDLWGG
jgi:hypothetical protein